MNLGPSYFVRFSPDGRLVASCGKRSVHLRRVAVAKPWIAVKLTNGAGGTFSPDGHSLLLKTTTGELGVVDLVGNGSFSQWPPSDGEGCAPCYSACGRFLLDGSWSGRLTVRDPRSGVPLRTVDFPEDMIVAIHPGAGDTWIVHHSPLAHDDHHPPRPDYFTVWSSDLADSPKETIRPGLAFVAASAVSSAFGLLALQHGAPPSHLTLASLTTGALSTTVDVESPGTGSRVVWSSAGILGVVQPGRVRFFSNELVSRAELPVEYACDVAFSSGGCVAVGSWKNGLLLDLDEVMKCFKAGDA